MKLLFPTLLILLLAGTGAVADAPADAPADARQASIVRWAQLPPLPAGAAAVGGFAGSIDGALLLAGGTGADGRPHDRVFLLPVGANAWGELPDRLPQPLANGVSIPTGDGIVCLGGSDGQQHSEGAFVLTVKGGQLHRRDLPRLPLPVAGACGALLGRTVYVAGGTSSPGTDAALHTFWALDLDDADAGWKSLQPWPGTGRTLATAAVQDGAFYLIGGAELAAGPDGKIRPKGLLDVYRYSSQGTPNGKWVRLHDLPQALIDGPGPAAAVGPSHIFVMGAAAPTGAVPSDAAPSDAAPNPTGVLAYHTITDTWANFGTTPGDVAGGTIVKRGDDLAVLGAASPPVLASFQRPKATFGLANLLTLALYPAIMLTIGFWCARRKKTSDQYFRANQRIPWWAAGLSIYATMLSSLTFMAIPAKVYISDWGFFLNYFSIVALAPVIIYFYLPFFRRLDVTSAYEYLERRFNLLIRLFGSASFIAFQVARTGIVLFLPALALSTVSDIDVAACIIGMTILSIALTVFGGIEAVIWTDVAQTIILLGAVVASLIVVVVGIDGGVGGIFHTAGSQGRLFEQLSWSPDLTIATGWVILLGFTFNNLISYTSNQEVVQRYLTTTDTRQAAKAIWTNALFSFPSGLIFFTMGTALFVFYRQHPERLDPTIQNDAIFPLFMLRELPAGVAGFVVAGIFAAAQPTSGLNSTATAFVTDFYRRLKRDVSDREALLMGRLATVTTGVLGGSVALIAVGADIRSIWELFINMMGLTTGILAGLFTLGILTRRANGTGATLGLGASLVAVLAAFLASPVHPMMYGVIGVLGAFGFGYLFSLPFEGQPLEGLTIYTTRQDEQAEAVGGAAVGFPR